MGGIGIHRTQALELLPQKIAGHQMDPDGFPVNNGGFSAWFKIVSLGFDPSPESMEEMVA